MVTLEQHRTARRGERALRPPQAAIPWPPQAELVLSAIETGQYTRAERRHVDRCSYRVQATLKLFSDAADQPPRVLFTRDINARGLGFITASRLPLGHGGLLDIVSPNGDERTIACTLLRCREAAPGWFEGALYFNTKQPDFAG